jgi:hypothetical protein
VGGEYVVLSIACRPDDGVSYLVLRDNDSKRTAALTAGMFELVSPRVPSSWVATDPYGTGLVFLLQPEDWSEPDFFERLDAGEPTARDVFRRNVEQMHREENVPIPS